MSAEARLAALEARMGELELSNQKLHAQVRARDERRRREQTLLSALLQRDLGAAGITAFRNASRMWVGDTDTKRADSQIVSRQGGAPKRARPQYIGSPLRDSPP